MPFRRANRFWRTALKILGGYAITMPWGRVYIAPDQFQNRGTTRFHELQHLKQIRRDGPVCFSLKYLWWCVRFGYWRNPYEIEAYAREAERYDV